MSKLNEKTENGKEPVKNGDKKDEGRGKKKKTLMREKMLIYPSLDNIVVPKYLLDMRGAHTFEEVMTDMIGKKADNLLESVKLHGIRQPVEVRKTNDHFELTFGLRRFACAKRLKHPSIPALVDNEGTELIALSENLFRQQANPLGEAYVLNAFLKAHPEIKKDDLHTHLPIPSSPSWITRTLALLDIPAEAKTAIAEGRLSAESAYTIQRQKDLNSAQKKKIFSESIGSEIGKGGLKETKVADKIKEEKGEQVTKPVCLCGSSHEVKIVKLCDVCLTSVTKIANAKKTKKDK